jgi:hypothetical protein
MQATMTPQEIEARLNAHRELMIDLLATLIGGGSVQDVLQRLSGEAMVVDSEEDPGAVPDPAFATENATAMEIRAILQAAQERAAAQKRL